MEAKLGVLAATFAGLVTFAALSAQAAPIPSKATIVELGTVEPIEQVAQGCGWGWHRHHWRDRWGYWHSGHCVPNG